MNYQKVAISVAQRVAIMDLDHMSLENKSQKRNACLNVR